MISSGRYLSTAVTFRGEMSLKDIDEQAFLVQAKNSPYFVEWIPNSLKTSHCKVSAPGTPVSASFIGNSTAISGVFERIAHQFGMLFGKKTYLHWSVIDCY